MQKSHTSALALCLLLLASAAQAATYYVATTGSDTNNGSSGSPWKHVWYAARQVAAGDTIIVRDGTYDVRDGWTMRASRAPYISPIADNVTFQSENPLGATLHGSIGAVNLLPIIGSHSEGGAITIDGFRIIGQVLLFRNNDTVKNCEITECGAKDTTGLYGGSDRQMQCIMLDGGSGITIYNNYLHSQLYVAFYATGRNSPGINVYDATNGEIHGNTIKGMWSAGIRLKDSAQAFKVHHNFILSSAQACMEGNAQDYDNLMEYYQNVCINNGKGWRSGTTSTGVKFYNNSLYGNGENLMQALGAGAEFYNNLVQTNTVHINVETGAQTSYSYWDENQYWGSGTWEGQSTFAGWQGLFGFDTDGAYTDPNYLNGSGLWSAAADLKRSSYPADGVARSDEIGGSGSRVRGAYLTGSEAIGYQGTVPDPVVRCFLDADGDGWSTGASEEVVGSCSANYYLPAQLTSTTGDCNDANAAIHPAATDPCGDGTDWDCSGADEPCPVPPYTYQRGTLRGVWR